MNHNNFSKITYNFNNKIFLSNNNNYFFFKLRLSREREQ